MAHREWRIIIWQVMPGTWLATPRAYATPGLLIGRERQVTVAGAVSLTSSWCPYKYSDTEMMVIVRSGRSSPRSRRWRACSCVLRSLLPGADSGGSGHGPQSKIERVKTPFGPPQSKLVFRNFWINEDLFVGTIFLRFCPIAWYLFEGEKFTDRLPICRLRRAAVFVLFWFQTLV